MAKALKEYWLKLESRERMILCVGTLLVCLILFYAIIWQPWHKAISNMQVSVQSLRTNLVWIKQQAELVENGGASAQSITKGVNQSLLSVIEQTAKTTKVKKAIQQMVPGRTQNEVRVVLEEADFNLWVKWVDLLFKQYGVQIKQLTAERDEDVPNIAEIRVTFERT